MSSFFPPIPGDFDSAFQQSINHKLSASLTHHQTPQQQQRRRSPSLQYQQAHKRSLDSPSSSSLTQPQPYKRPVIDSANTFSPLSAHPRSSTVAAVTPSTLSHILPPAASSPPTSTTSPSTLTLSSATAPVCKGHSEPMREFVTRKEGSNNGRRFWKCSNANPCSSFEWADLAQRTLNPTSTTSASTQLQQRVTVCVHMEVMDINDFAVTFHPFSTHLVELFKAQSGRYVEAVKHWLFPLAHYDALHDALHALQQSTQHVSLDLTDDIPRNLRRFLNRPLPKPPQIDEAAFRAVLPTALSRALLPFQVHGVMFALSKGGKVALADEMGVGKSVQAIAVMSWYSADWPVLIVCPSSLRLNWRSEILKWYGPSADDDSKAGGGSDGGDLLDMDGRIDIIMKGSDERQMEARLRSTDKRYITIISYDLVPKLHKTIETVDYGITIADESHMIKSYTAKRTKALLPILKNSRRTLLLSGTPALNRPAELFTQLHALMPSLFTSFQSFGNRYCDPQLSKWGKQYDGGTHLHELHWLLTRYVMIRRLKCDVLRELPPKRRQAVIVECELSELKREMKGMNRMEAQLRQLVEHDRDSPATTEPAADEEQKDSSGRGGGRWSGDIMHLFTLTALAKEKVVVEYVKDLLESLDKFLVFFHHRSIADALAAMLADNNTSFIRIDGATPTIARQQHVDAFQSDPSIRVGLLSITAASTGFTLHAASTVIFVELFWSPAWLLQAEDRVHRIGTQAACVNIQYMLGKGTVDELIWPLLCSKLECLSLALNGMKSDAAMGIDAINDRRQEDGNGDGRGSGAAGQQGIRGYMQ